MAFLVGLAWGASCFVSWFAGMLVALDSRSSLL